MSLECHFKSEFVFDGIKVTPQTNSLTRNGREKRLEPKLIELLCLFAQHPKQVLTRDQLNQAIWHEQVVGDDALNRAIFALRGALGDDAKKPRYIETIPKRGYRFLSVVKVEHSRKQQRPLLVLIIALFLTLAGGLTLFFTTSEPRTLEIDSIKPVTYHEGAERFMTIDASGQQMLYVRFAPEGNRIYLKQLNNQDEQAVSEFSDSYFSLQWIDNSSWFYVKYDGTQWQVFKQRTGQAPELIYSSDRFITGIAYTPQDSDNLLLTESINPENTHLYKLDIQSGELEDLHQNSKLPNRIGFMHYSRDGKALYFVAQTKEGVDIYELQLKSSTNPNQELGTLTILSSEFDRIDSFNLSTRNSELIVSGQKHKAQGLWLLNIDQRDSSLLLRSSDAPAIYHVAASPQRQAIYYENTRYDFDLLHYSTQNKELKALDKLNNLARDGLIKRHPLNQDLYFVSNRSESVELWRYDASTQNLSPLSQLGAINISSYVFSNNGNYIAIGYQQADKHQLAVLETKSGKIVHRKTTDIPMFPLRWSQDQQHIYISEHQSKVVLYRFNIELNEQQIIKESAGLFTQESDDGKSLYFIDYSEQALVQRKDNKDQVISRKIRNLKWLRPGQAAVFDKELRVYYPYKGRLYSDNYQLSTEPEQQNDQQGLVIHQYAPENSWVSWIDPSNADIYLNVQRMPQGSIQEIRLKSH
ncbi:winged helix-turn-helix domain-containing protein [Agaribacterium sp. ZY112]|uniref:winged helix-turn-helix domain-containing protein n=1 Tax=Agaribacterium sp. ZY112 TaxID=3233574 RepID=UPI003525C451